MNEILLDEVLYSDETGLVLSATVYSYDSKRIERLGIWKREDIVRAIKQGQKVVRATVDTNVLNEYIAHVICYIDIREIEGKSYLKHSEYISDLQKDDMIEFNRAIRNRL